MAILRSSYNERLLCVMGLFGLLLIQRGGAYEFKVGGTSGWSVPSDPQSYNQWAENNRFQIGDTLLFECSSQKDSVLLVTKEQYTNCMTDKPLANFTNGHTVFKFNRSGPFYFISGNKDNCLKNEKLHIIVLADRSGNKSSSPLSPTLSPALVPSGNEVPLPKSESNPSPALVPSGNEFPSPPVESNPSPAPEESNPAPEPVSDEGQTQAPPKSGASSFVMSGVGLVGAFVGSSLVSGL